LDKFDDGISKQLFKNKLVNQGRKPTGMRYSKEIKEFVLTLSYYSPKALTYCRYLMLMLAIATYYTIALLRAYAKGFLELPKIFIFLCMQDNKNISGSGVTSS